MGEAQPLPAVGFGRGSGCLDLSPNDVAVVALIRQHDAAAGRRSSSSAPALQSGACPPVSRKASGRQKQSVRAWIFVVRPPRERPMAWLYQPLCPLRRTGGPSQRWDESARKKTARRLGRGSQPADPDPLGRPAHEEIGEGLPLPVEIVRPYVKAQKNDDRNAEAIAEAATRSTMRFMALEFEAQLTCRPCIGSASNS